MNKLRLADCDYMVVGRKLAEVTLAHLITFNRRRQGEVSKIIISDYERRTTVDLSSDSMDALSPVYRQNRDR